MFSGAEGRETVFSEKLASLEAWYADPDNPVNAKMDLALSRITGGESCLDIGCRTGEALLRLQRLAKFRTLFGIDIDPENVEYCRRKVAHATNIFVSVGDALELGFGANSFDCVTVLDVLEHIRNPRLVLCEVERAAKRGGQVVLSVPGPYDLLYSRLLRLNRGEHKVALFPQQWFRLVQNAGFRVNSYVLLRFPLSRALSLSRFWFVQRIFVTWTMILFAQKR